MHHCFFRGRRHAAASVLLATNRLGSKQNAVLATAGWELGPPGPGKPPPVFLLLYILAYHVQSASLIKPKQISVYFNPPGLGYIRSRCQSRVRNANAQIKKNGSIHVTRSAPDLPRYINVPIPPNQQRHVHRAQWQSEPLCRTAQ